MPKYEFIKETRADGSSIYYTNKNGWYVHDSLSINYEKALGFFNKIKQQGESVSTIEVLETIERA